MTLLFRTAVLGASLLLLTGCAANTLESSVSPSTVEATAPTSNPVDETLETVDITIPASLLGDLTDDELYQMVADQGYVGYARNPDGSVTYRMSLAKRDETLQSAAMSVEGAFAAMVSSEPSILAITHSEDFRSITIEVDQEAFEATDSAALIGVDVALSATFYQMYDGVGAQDYLANIDYLDADSQVIYRSETFPPQVDN
jgi:hypothetical protein